MWIKWFFLSEVTGLESFCVKFILGLDLFSYSVVLIFSVVTLVSSVANAVKLTGSSHLRDKPPGPCEGVT